MKPCNEFVRVLCDRYDLKLLKNHIKLHRAKGFSAVHCKVSDTTRI